MSVPIRKGYSVNTTDSSGSAFLKLLKAEKLISLSTNNFVICSRCKNSIPLNHHNIENFVTCSVCTKRQNTSSKVNSKNVISQIHYEGLIKKISSLLSYMKIAYEFDKNSRYWKVCVGDKIIPLLILEISDSNFVLANAENQASLFVMLDAERHATMINQFNASQFIEFAKILVDGELLSKSLQTVSTTFDTNYSLELEKKFDKLRGTISPTQFEQFCVDLLELIKAKYQKLQTFYTYLTRLNNTMLNTKIIPIGGPSNPDFVMINLLRYLQSGLQPEKFGEAKRYGENTKFTWEKYSSAIMHGNANDALILISTTDIQLEVWVNILKNDNNDKFKYVLLDKPLILILIKCLGMENLIEKYLNSTNKK